MPKMIQNKNIRNLSKHSSCKHRFCQHKTIAGLNTVQSNVYWIWMALFLVKLIRSVWEIRERYGLVHIHIKSNKTSKAVQDQYLQNLHLNNLIIYTVQARGKHTTLQRTREQREPRKCAVRVRPRSHSRDFSKTLCTHLTLAVLVLIWVHFDLVCPFSLWLIDHCLVVPILLQQSQLLISK